ncbi:MAG TPA: MFS transporter [Nocardioidaceae bacterium]|nr:MFS transporter [Nocardioidaceae bacterium]
MTDQAHGDDSAPAVWPQDRVRRVQRRTVRTLVLSQALGGLGMSIGIAVAALLAEQVSGSEKLAGLAQTMQVVGAAVASLLLARVMGIHGRRVGLVLGYLLGATGAALCVWAGVAGSFALLMVATTLLGAATAANSLSRYAATDVAEPQARARALSVVVWATTIGAVAGPNLTGLAGRAGSALGLPVLTGPFVFAVVGMLAAGAVVAVLMRPDPLLVAREAALARGEAARGRTSWRRVAEVVRTHPGVAAGSASLALAHAVMVAVMVMTPLHMHHGGAALEVIGVVISVHVLGMFALAPVVGWSADRFGRPPVLLAGAGVLLASLVLSGTSPAGASYQIGAGLFLLGLGWSLCTVAASTLLSESAPLDARTDVQGAADLAMGLTAAVAGALAGVVVGSLGYPALNAFAALLAGGVVVAAEYARRTSGPVPAKDVSAL